MISIDPGKHQTAIAVWSPEGELLWAGLLSTVSLLGNEEKSRQMVPTNNPRTIIEVPQVYQTALQKGDQNDLIDLAVVAGALGQVFGNPVFRRPREWKGQTPKEIIKLRVEEALSDVEFKRVIWPSAKSLHHNVFDAIGIGLQDLKRIR